jgi:hypothetical protein
MVVTREDGAWLASAAGVAGAHTESDDVRSLDRYAREVCTLADGAGEHAMADCEFEWVFEVSDADLAAAAAEARGVSVAEVLAQGWSLADVAALLDVPATRVTHVPPRGGAHIAHG